MNSVIVGQRIRDARKLLKLTQEELGQQVCADGKYISRLENGKSLPSLKKLVQLARVLDQTCDYFVWDIDDMADGCDYISADSTMHDEDGVEIWREYA